MNPVFHMVCIRTFEIQLCGVIQKGFQSLDTKGKPNPTATEWSSTDDSTFLLFISHTGSCV